MENKSRKQAKKTKLHQTERQRTAFILKQRYLLGRVEWTEPRVRR